MAEKDQTTPPPVLWAQRSNLLYLTICLEDCKDPIVKTENDKVYFKNVGGTDKKTHEVTINLFKEIDPEKTVQIPKGRNFELVLYKKESGPFWPRLTKENSKFHWLKCDFNKWKDEDESEDEEGNGMSNNFEEYMQHMGGFGGNGNMKPNFDDIDLGDDADGPDSDDDEMPDLE